MRSTQKKQITERNTSKSAINNREKKYMDDVINNNRKQELLELERERRQRIKNVENSIFLLKQKEDIDRRKNEELDGIITVV